MSLFIWTVFVSSRNTNLHKKKTSSLLKSSNSTHSSPNAADEVVIELNDLEGVSRSIEGEVLVSRNKTLKRTSRYD